MAALGVRVLASDWATHFLASMLLTLLHHIADSLAHQVVYFLDFFTRHHLVSQLVRVIDLVARELSFRLVADTAFVD